mgnify:CR=1 FL=1
MLAQYEIGVIGSGNAAEGIVHAILRNTILFADRIVASDPSESRRKLFADRFQIAHQRAHVGISQFDVFHIHDGVRESGVR